MLPPIWPKDLTIVFVGTVVTDLSETLGFYHLDPRDRFWELLEMSAITPKRVMTVQECKAMIQGHKDGSVAEPIRAMFVEKKTSQLLKLGIGLTNLNRKVIALSERDKVATPSDDSIRDFVANAEERRAKILAFVTGAEVFVDSLKGRYSEANEEPGLQSFTIGGSEVWFLGSTSGRPRGEALSKQEDAFFALGERVEALRKELK
jgi:G:T/U-mismatch repair DNA glycosylase